MGSEWGPVALPVFKIGRSPLTRGGSVRLRGASAILNQQVKFYISEGRAFYRGGRGGSILKVTGFSSVSSVCSVVGSSFLGRAPKAARRERSERAQHA
jgi:hypothetical protein